ncbi:MAG: hypothetical protein JO133_12810 [Burkholderiaceae bacterium]|nr:hypothetical protein [Burkholderiaceae bacterium]
MLEPDDPDLAEAQAIGGFLRDRLVAPLLCAAAVVFLILSLHKSAPEPEELTEISGTVRDVNAVQECSWGFCNPAIIITLDEAPDRYHIRPTATGFIYLLRIPHTAVRTYVEKQPSFEEAHLDATKTWGLCVNGKWLVTLEDSLRTDNFFAHTVCPIIAIFLAAAGVVRFLEK